MDEAAPQLRLPGEIEIALYPAVYEALHDVSSVDVDGDEGDDFCTRFLGQPVEWLVEWGGGRQKYAEISSVKQLVPCGGHP